MLAGDDVGGSSSANFTTTKGNTHKELRFEHPPTAKWVSHWCLIAKAEPKLLDTLGLAADEWRVLALDVQKHAITMLNGLDKVAALKQRAVKRVA